MTQLAGTLYADFSGCDVTLTPNVVYAHRESRDLTMQILTPYRPNYPWKPPVFKPNDPKAHFHHGAPQKDARRFPLIVAVPGSGWSGGEGMAYVPRMVELAAHGYVVACISYRGTFRDDVRFPAAVQDTKEAVRFMRAHAEEYLVDVDRVALLGDSSGGHTVALAALTGDEPRFTLGEHLEQTSRVKSCVIFYGPNDLLNLVPDRLAEGKTLRPGEGEYPFEAREIFQDDFLQAPKEMLAEASPINYIRKDGPLPPFLFFNGDKDPIIPVQQGVRFCEKVRACGGVADFNKIIGAAHGAGCWTKETMQLIIRFLGATV